MKKYLIDTNALISFVTDRNLKQQETVSPIFADATHGKCSLACHPYALAEFAFVMEKIYFTDKETIRNIIRDFLSMPGVVVFHNVDISLVLQYWPDTIPDFGDALFAAVAKKEKGYLVVTFDQKFQSSLKRLGLQIFTLV